jgi:hypothetical protein|nr:MAG TPA: dimeris T4 recombination endonuclease VII [Caudoviricetes sp.]DAP24858.1 MAG TPA: dimeris T4 recombination endonuclease VII [Bacteriophage sp.]DAX48178.1 MAG TPA: dimeris T4 recombination endonuclease VII [Caudoviricetes sp.]
MTKADISEVLTERGIDHNMSMLKEELVALAEGREADVG